MSQPTQSDDADQPRVPGEHGWIIAATAAMAFAVIGAAVDAATRIDFPRGAYAILVAVFVFAGISYTIRSAQAKVIRCQQRAAADGDERERQGYARGYVDGMSGHAPEPARHLQSVN